MSKNIIYILPHHDDEIFVIPKINDDLKKGHNLLFFFLMKSELRLKESQKFLLGLGVKTENIISIGSKLNVTDGVIHLSIDKIYLEIKSHLVNLNGIHEVLCTAYEGGHNDHDVAAILGRATAKHFKAKVMEFFLYNGSGTRGKIYRVANPVKVLAVEKFKYSFHDFITVLKAPFIFVSQMSAMLGLWPFLLLKVVMRTPLTLNVLNAQDFKIVHHTDIPLYERWKRINHDDFLGNVQQFISSNDL